jgi:uncharacterized protein
MSERVSLPAHISLVTLGVADITRARAFYQALGWPVVLEDGDDYYVFDTSGPLLGLYPLSTLAEECGVPAGSGVRASMSINVGSEADVDAGLAAAEAAGGRITKPGQKMFWGGYSGYFTDPDGHVWEVAHNPHWPLDERGRPQLSR